MNKTLKKTLKGLKPPKVPDRVKLLSLLAIVLVVGAPALISTIDDSMSDVYYTAVDSPDSLGDPYLFKIAATPPDTEIKYSLLSADENDGTNVFLLNDVSKGQYIGRMELAKFDNTLFDNKVSKIIINLEGTDFKKLYLSVSGVGATYFLNFENVVEAGIPTDTYILELSSLDLVKLKNPDVTIKPMVSFDDGEFSGIISWDFTTYTSNTIAYGEIIIGATGAILLLCALFATPYFGVFKKKGVKS